LVPGQRELRGKQEQQKLGSRNGPRLVGGLQGGKSIWVKGS